MNDEVALDLHQMQTRITNKIMQEEEQKKPKKKKPPKDKEQAKLLEEQEKIENLEKFKKMHSVFKSQVEKFEDACYKLN